MDPYAGPLNVPFSPYCSNTNPASAQSPRTQDEVSSDGWGLLNTYARLIAQQISKAAERKSRPIQLTTAGSSLWIRSKTLLQQLDRCSGSINSAEDLFEELLSIIEAQVATHEPIPARNASQDSDVTEQHEVLQMQRIIKEKDTEIERLNAECGELRTKNKLLFNITSALSSKNAALHNDLLEASKTRGTGNDSREEQMAMPSGSAANVDTVTSSQQKMVNEIEGRLLRSSPEPGTPPTSCSTTFFTPPLNSPRLSDRHSQVEREVINLGYDLENAWSTPRPRALGEQIQTLAPYPGGKRKRNIGSLTASPSPLSKRLKLAASQVSPGLGANNAVVIADDEDESGDSDVDQQSLDSARQRYSDPKDLEGKLSNPHNGRDRSLEHDHIPHSTMFRGDNQETLHVSESRMSERDDGEECSGTPTPSSRSSSVLSTIVVGGKQTLSPRRDPQESVFSLPLNNDPIDDAGARRSNEIPVKTADLAPEQFKRKILASYQKHGLHIPLVFSYVPEVYDPRSIDMKSTWKNRSILDGRSWTRLESLVDDVARCFPSGGEAATVNREGALLKRVCFGQTEHTVGRTLQDIILLLHTMSKCSRDEARLLKFECYSVLVVLRSQDRGEYERITQKLDEYQVDVLHVYQSLHGVLNQLQEVWRGMHTPLLLFMLRAGISRLLKLFASSTRPAAIALLSGRLNSRDFVAKASPIIQAMIDAARTEPHDGEMLACPLQRIEDRVCVCVRAGTVRQALLYDPSYVGDAAQSGSSAFFATPNSTNDGWRMPSERSNRVKKRRRDGEDSGPETRRSKRLSRILEYDNL